MDPLSITAASVGIAAPAIHCVHLLLDDIQNIIDAPPAIEALKVELGSVDHALTSLQAVTDKQWESLGEVVVAQAKSATTKCKDTCDGFRNKLGRWTRHSSDGNMSLRDRAIVGIFKQKRIELMSTQFQSCKNNLILVASIATLHTSLASKEHNQATLADVSTKEAEIEKSITTVDKALSEVNANLGKLCLAKQDENETEIDRQDAITQAAVTQSALGDARKLLEALLSGVKAATREALQGQGRVVNNFGSHNEGMQIGTNYAAMSGLTFGKK